MQQNDVNIAHRIAEEHETLRSLREAVASSFASPPEGDFANWKLDLVWELRDFRNALVKHFDLEEDGGFMFDVVDTAPHEKPHVDILESEHAEFIREVDSITTDLKGQSDSSIIPGLGERLDTLIARLNEHEELERELIGTVYFQDLGTGD